MRRGDIKLSKETKTFELCNFCYYLRTPCALSYLLAGRECPRWKAVSSDSEQNLCNFLLSSMEMVGHLLIIFESAHQQHFSRVITNWKWKLGSNLHQISLNWNQLQSGPLLFSSITRKRTNYDRNGKSESVKVKVWKCERESGKLGNPTAGEEEVAVMAVQRKLTCVKDQTLFL